jgi:hypothetical protein
VALGLVKKTLDSGFRRKEGNYMLWKPHGYLLAGQVFYDKNACFFELKR